MTKRLPVGLQSLLIQLIALALAVLAVRAASAFLPFDFALWQLAVVQGGLAAVLSLAWRQPRWWIPLHAAFLPAALAAARL
ncbi:MAG: class I SAM-dependent methyltransferase, partial [Pseudomonadota bacterium]